MRGLGRFFALGGVFLPVPSGCRKSPPSTVLDDGAERQAVTSTTCWSSAKEIRHARPSQ